MEWLRKLTHGILQVTHGRTTAFFVSFFLAGHVMAVLHLLTPVYVGFMGTLGGLVLGHSIKDDIAQRLNPSQASPDPTGGSSDGKS